MRTTQCHEQTQKPDDKNPSGGAAKIRRNIMKHNEFNNAQKKLRWACLQCLEQYRQLSLGGGGWSGRGHKDDVNVMSPHLVPRMLTQEAMPSRPRSKFREILPRWNHHFADSFPLAPGEDLMRGYCIKGRPNENTFPSSFLASLATPHDIIFLRIANKWGLGTSLTLLSDSLANQNSRTSVRKPTNRHKWTWVGFLAAILTTEWWSPQKYAKKFNNGDLTRWKSYKMYPHQLQTSKEKSRCNAAYDYIFQKGFLGFPLLKYQATEGYFVGWIFTLHNCWPQSVEARTLTNACLYTHRAHGGFINHSIKTLFSKIYKRIVHA